MGNEVTVGILQAVLRLKDEMTPAIKAVTDNLASGFSNVEQKVSGVAKTLGGVGTALLATFSITAIVQTIEALGEWGEKIVSLSARLGISTEMVQRFQYAAEQGGSSIQTITRAMEFMSRQFGENDTHFAKLLQDMGLSFERLRNQAPDQQFIALARALNAIEDPAMRDYAAFTLFSRSGQEIQQFLPDLMADMARAPVAFEGAAEKADRLGDAWERLKASSASLLGTFGTGALAAAFDNTADKMDRLKESSEAWGELLTTGSLSKALTRGDDGLAAAFKIAADGAKGLSDAGIKPLTVSIKDAAQIEKDIEASIKKTNKAREEAAKAIAKEDAAYRSFTNFASERMMEDEAREMARLQQLGSSIMLMREQNNPQLLLQSSNLDTASLMNLPGEVTQKITLAAEQARSIWTPLFADLRNTAADSLTAILFRTTSFKDGFISIWQSLKQSLMNIVSDLLNNVLGGLMRGIGGLLGGGGFSAGMGGLGGLFGGGGGLLGGLFGGGGGAAASTSIMGGGGMFGSGGGGLLGGLFSGGGSAAASGLFAAGGASAGLASGAAIDATTAGLAGGSGGIMGSLGAFFTNPLTIGAAAAAALGLGIWKGGLFRGGEEALKVNPARDEFFSQFGDVQNRGTGGANWNLAAKLTELGFGEGGGSLFANLQNADTMKEFEAATKAVNDALATGTQTATTDSATLTTVSAQSSNSINTLSGAIANLAQASLAATSVITTTIGATGVGAAASAGLPGGLPGVSGLMDPNRYKGVPIIDENGNVYEPGTQSLPYGLPGVPQFAKGTRGSYPDFGKGTLAMLHGRERVMTEGEGSGASLSISIGDIHVGTGDSSEVRRAAAMGVLDALEKGGPAWTKFRILATQAVG